MRLAMKPFVFAFVLTAALCVGLTSQGYGYVISGPDSLGMSARVGTSSDGYVWISDGLDSNAKLPAGTIHISLSGNSEFSLVSDSVVQFLGVTTIRVRYNASSGTDAFGELTVVGDSNTVHVQLIGVPISHYGPEINTSNYDSLRSGVEECQNFGLYNKDIDTIWITNIVLIDDPAPGTQWSLKNVASLPTFVPGNSAWSLGELCALATASDSSLSGQLWIYYRLGNTTDSIMADLYGRRSPLDSRCVTVAGTVDVSASEGQTVSSSFLLTNTTDSSIYLDGAQIVGDTDEFAITSPQFPLVLERDSSVVVYVSYSVPSPAASDNYYGTFEAEVYGTSVDGVSCDPVRVALSGSVSIPVVDSITLDVPPGTNSLSITAHAEKTRHAIFIHNAGSNALLLEHLGATAADTNVRVSFPPYDDGIYIYDSLAAGATSQELLMTLEAPDTGTYDLTMTLTYTVQQSHPKEEHTSSSTLTYNVIAHRLPPVTEGVSEPKTTPVIDFTLSPNPARDEVTIGVPEGPSTIEIYDVLGNRVFREAAQGSLTWDGRSGGAPVANGAYIVRISTPLGTSSKRLMLQR